jgi:hypothetical protein
MEFRRRSGSAVIRSASMFSGCLSAFGIFLQTRTSNGVGPAVVPGAGSVLDRLTSRHLPSSLVIRTGAGSS